MNCMVTKPIHSKNKKDKYNSVTYQYQVEVNQIFNSILLLFTRQEDKKENTLNSIKLRQGLIVIKLRQKKLLEVFFYSINMNINQC